MCIYTYACACACACVCVCVCVYIYSRRALAVRRRIGLGALMRRHTRALPRSDLRLAHAAGTFVLVKHVHGFLLY